MNRLKIVNRLLFALLLALAALSCGKVEDVVNEPSERILLVYMGTDNNLSAETYEQIDALRQGWEVLGEGTLYIYADPANDRPFLLKIGKENGENVSKTVHEYKESNSADKSIFATVINDVRALHEAGTVKSFGLLVFSHATGWIPMSMKMPEGRTIIVDGEQEMELLDFVGTIPDGFFDFIIFDACYTAGIEMMYELRNKANFIVGSSAEILTPGYTPYYPEVLKYLFQPDVDLTSFMQTIFNGIDAHTGHDRAATFSIVKTSELEPLRDFIYANCDFTKKLNIAGIQDFGRLYMRSLFFDFEACYASLLSSIGQRIRLLELVNNCVIYKAATPDFLLDDNGFVVEQHSGMTTYMTQPYFPKLNDAWSKLAWYASR